MERPNALEEAVLAKLVEGEHGTLVTLKDQLRDIEVLERKLTGVGFFTTLRVSPVARRLTSRRSFRFGDVIAQMSGLRHGAGFVLFVDDGVITGLEGYTFDEQWPQSTERLTLNFENEERDFSILD
jgi:hypothetical protein